MLPVGTTAPELDVERWRNGPGTTLAALRGQVVVIETFQMLCPGCVAYGLPLAKRVAASFEPAEVRVIGVHTVFEHHAVMGPEALEVFCAEYGLEFLIGIDRHEPGDDRPVTMRRYGLPGTPCTLVVDRDGVLRFAAFGPVDELVLGARIGSLLASPAVTPATAAASPGACDPNGACAAPTAGGHHDHVAEEW